MSKIFEIYLTSPFFSYKYNNYLSTTHIYLQDESNKIINKKAFFNSSIYRFISIDFDTHIRFFYKKDETKYLDAKRVMNILNNDKEKAILRADVFPYLQEKLYLNYENYDFAKHSMVIGASGTGKSKLISYMIKEISKNNYNKLKYKVVVIDPHAAIEEDIGGLSNTKVIDFKTEENSINLFENSSEDIIACAESIMAIFKNIIADKYNSRLEEFLDIVYICY